MLFFVLNAFAQQNVAINNDGSPPNPSAILDVQSNDKGILIPRMTTIERENIQNPPAGLMVYDINIESFFYHTGVNGLWKNMLANLDLPYFEGVTLDNAAFHIQNAEPLPTAIAGQFTAAEGTGVYANAGNIGGKFWGGTTGIDVTGGGNGGYAGKFYSANGRGVYIDINGVGESLIVENGRTGLGTSTPNAKLHVRDANASNGNTTGEAIFKASAYQPSIPDEMNLEYWIAQPAGGQPNEPYFGMRSNHRLNLVSNNNISNPEISILDNKVGINKQDGTYPLSINGKTAIYENNVYMGEIYGNETSGDLHIQANHTTVGNRSDPDNLILQTPVNQNIKLGYVGINTDMPTSYLEVSKQNDENATVTKLGNSYFNQSALNNTGINGGNPNGTGKLQLNDVSGADVHLASAGGDVLMPNENSSFSIGTNNKDFKLNINGTTGIYNDNVYMGEIYGDQATGDLYINSMKAISGMDGFLSKNLILQPHINGKKAGKVGININLPTAFLEVGKGNFPFTPAAKFGNSKFDEDDKNSTSISGGNSDANVANRGALVLNAEVTAPVYIATGGGNVLMSHPNTKLSIGTEVNTHSLNVNGSIRSTELIVESGWADYVFAKDYLLKPIADVENYINEHKHLPNIPPASEIQENGLKVSEISTKMMEKIEEMMLYIIEQNKQIKDLQREVNELKNKK